jgi:hypothetical protein
LCFFFFCSSTACKHRNQNPTHTIRLVTIRKCLTWKSIELVAFIRTMKRVHTFWWSKPFKSLQSLYCESQRVMKEIEISQVRDIPSSRKLGMLTLRHRAFCISGTSCHLVHTLQYLFIPGLPWLMKIQMNHASNSSPKGNMFTLNQSQIFVSASLEQLSPGERSKSNKTFKLQIMMR